MVINALCGNVLGAGYNINKDFMEINCIQNACPRGKSHKPDIVKACVI